MAGDYQVYSQISDNGIFVICTEHGVVERWPRDANISNRAIQAVVDQHEKAKHGGG